MMSSSTVLIDIVKKLKPLYKSVNYSSNQGSPKFGSYNMKFSRSMNPIFLSLRRHFSSLLVNFGQNNLLFRPILRACRSMDSCIYLRQWITNMFKYSSQSIQPSAAGFGHFSLTLGMYNWKYCPYLTKALMVKDCSYEISIETLQNFDKKKCHNIPTDFSQLICFDFYCSKFKERVFPVLAKIIIFFWSKYQLRGTKRSFYLLHHLFLLPFTNISSLNSKFQILCHPNFV